MMIFGDSWAVSDDVLAEAFRLCSSVSRSTISGDNGSSDVMSFFRTYFAVFVYKV